MIAEICGVLKSFSLENSSRQLKSSLLVDIIGHQLISRLVV